MPYEMRKGIWFFVKPIAQPSDFLALGREICAWLFFRTPFPSNLMTQFGFFSLSALAGLTLSQGVLAADVMPDRWLVSTTAIVAPEIGLIDGDDVCLFQVEVGMPAFTHTARGHWFAQAGFIPGDVDAIAMLPGTAAGRRGSIAFSLLSNEGGFLDGDILGVGPNGALEVLVTESTLLAALGLPLGGIDVDGLDFDDQGRLLFSLQNNASGSVIGYVNNGDILRLEANGGLSRVYAEDEVQAALDVALTDAGLPIAPLGDVHGIAFFGGDVYVAVQSPTAVDGSILRMGSVPALVADEVSLGLQGSELDGLVALGANWNVGSVGLDHSSAMPGNVVRGEGHGFTPDSLVMILMAGQPGFGLDLGFGGFGELFIDPNDPWLQVAAAAGFSLVASDASGSFGMDFQLPPGEWGGMWSGGQGWSFQALDLANLELTAPFRVQLF